MTDYDAYLIIFPKLHPLINLLVLSSEFCFLNSAYLIICPLSLYNSTSANFAEYWADTNLVFESSNAF